jgi:beta-lactamase class A
MRFRSGCGGADVKCRPARKEAFCTGRGRVVHGSSCQWFIGFAVSRLSSYPSQQHAVSMLERRTVLRGFAAMILLGAGVGREVRAEPGARADRLRSIEESARGRLGAYILDTRTNTGFGWREDERFGHCSSFKLSLAAMVLHMADRGEVELREHLRWTAQEILPVSPVTAANVEHGLSLEELARATLITSDNTAANVLLRRFGGPSALTAFWRSLGDEVSRLDRYEPELNETPPGTTLDTTTPRAMAHTLAALVHGNALAPASKAKLKAWMTEVRTGAQRIRAGLPTGWESGDKTGTGIGRTKHTYVDIAFGGPPGRDPLIITAYFEPGRLGEPMDPVAVRALAQVGEVAAAALTP